LLQGLIRFTGYPYGVQGYAPQSIIPPTAVRVAAGFNSGDKISSDTSSKDPTMLKYNLTAI
jgi:hypothetical protein